MDGVSVPGSHGLLSPGFCDGQRPQCHDTSATSSPHHPSTFPWALCFSPRGSGCSEYWLFLYLLGFSLLPLCSLILLLVSNYFFVGVW